LVRKQRVPQMIVAMSVGLDDPPKACTAPNRLRRPFFKAQAISFGEDSPDNCSPRQ